MSRTAVLLSALLLLAPACKDREDPGATGTKVTAESDPFVAAFSLTEGEIRGQVDDRPPVEQADGVTWHIRDGKFQSVVSGLTLAPGSVGWLTSARHLVARAQTRHAHER